MDTKRPNDLLRASRERTPSRLAPGECMSRRELAEALNAWLWETTRQRYDLDAHTIARYERGAVRWPGAAYRSGLRHVLGAATDAELGFWPARQHPAPIQSGDRNLPTRAAAVAPLAASAGAESRERLTSATRRPSRIDRAVVEHLELVTQTHRVLYHSLRSVELVAAVTGHLQVTTLLLDGAQQLPLRRRLAMVAGETAGHAAWLFHDLGEQSTAARYYAKAEAALAEAGDPALDAYVRSFHSLVLGSEGQLGDALILARSAAETADRSTTGTTRAWLASVEAQLLASVGDRQACFASLRRAEVALGQARREEDPGWMYKFDQARLLALAGACYGQLGRLTAAERALRQALDELSAECSRRRAEVLVNLARVRAQQQDVDEAAGLARESLAIAVDTSSEAGVRRIRRLRPELARWDGARSVRALDEQLDGLR
ncbi:MAG: tetratricopeptide repeat protein [Actinomycetota bacterium]|nr:tetratricopeptide repeat protein [Actinomycetota bacterium]